MAKGSIAKAEITNKILEYFPNAFLNDKEIRIPFIEDGETVEIKFTLTCAKTNIGEEPKFKTSSVNDMIEPTAEEKAKVKELIDSWKIF